MARSTTEKMTLQVKKTPTTAAGFSKVEAECNAGNIPLAAKVTIEKRPLGKMAIIDGLPIGIIQGNDGKPYPCSEFHFDDKGICVDDYEAIITGFVPGATNAVHMSVLRHLLLEKVAETNDLSLYEDEIQRIVNANICTEEDIRLKVSVMMQNQCSKKVIFRVLAAHVKFNPNVRKPKSLYVSVQNDGHMQKVLIQAMSRFAMVLSGGQSVGKNVMAETIAWLLNMNYFLITFSQDMTPDDIFGGKSTDNSASAALTKELAKAALAGDEDAKVMYDLYKAKAASVQIVMDESAFCTWLQEGGVMCFNEMNLIEANLFASFANQIADGTGFIFVPGRGRLNVHPDCVLIGTQNPGFEGTLTQNQATMSRFGIRNFGYPKEITGPLKAALPDIADEVPNTVWDRVNSLYMECLAATQSGEISDACLNIRGFARAIRNFVEWEDSLLEQIMINVVNTCSDNDKAVIAKKVTMHFDE